MKLVFYGRDAQPAVAPSTPLLSIDRKGVFSFSVGAVARLGLEPHSPLVLAQDVDTNTWYCVPGVVPGHESFVLKPRDSKGTRALTFHSLPQVRAYWQAHGLNGQKSVRTLVAATPVEQDGLRLYPLTPQHPTQAPPGPVATEPAPALALAEPAAPAAVEPEPAAPAPVVEPQPAAPAAESAQGTDKTDETDSKSDTPDTELDTTSAPGPAGPAAQPAASKYTPEMDARLLDPANSPSALAQEWGVSAAALHSRRAMLKKKAGLLPGQDLPAAPVATPAAPQLVYTPAPVAGQPAGPAQHKTFGLHARAEELTATWSERELSQAKPNELAEVLNLLRMVPESKRSVEMGLVLERAEREHAHRQTVAGKEGRRG